MTPPVPRQLTFPANPRPRTHLFDGDTFQRKDARRLSSQFARMLDLMRDGEFRTLEQIRAVVGGKETSLSARLRDCRKPRFQQAHGIKSMESVEYKDGLWYYKLIMEPATGRAAEGG